MRQWHADGMLLGTIPTEEQTEEIDSLAAPDCKVQFVANHHVQK